MISPIKTTNTTDTNMAIQSGAILFNNIGRVSLEIELATNNVDKSKWCYLIRGNIRRA